MKKILNLRFYIGGYDAVNYTIDYQEGIVKYKKYQMAYTGEGERKEVSTEEADILAKQLTDLGVQDWNRSYESPVLDGTQWELDINFNDHTKKVIFGSNAYPNPDKDDFVEYSRDFERLVEILANFIGDPSFFR